jgi:hypothetical protein
LTRPRRVVGSGIVPRPREGGRADADEPGLLLLSQAVALAADIQDVAVMEQAITAVSVLSPVDQ